MRHHPESLGRPRWQRTNQQMLQSCYAYEIGPLQVAVKHPGQLRARTGARKLRVRDRVRGCDAVSHLPRPRWETAPTDRMDPHGQVWAKKESGNRPHCGRDRSPCCGSGAGNCRQPRKTIADLCRPVHQNSRAGGRSRSQPLVALLSRRSQSRLGRAPPLDPGEAAHPRHRVGHEDLVDHEELCFDPALGLGSDTLRLRRDSAGSEMRRSRIAEAWHADHKRTSAADLGIRKPLTSA
jgi:hypothetical protein